MFRQKHIGVHASTKDFIEQRNLHDPMSGVCKEEVSPFPSRGNREDPETDQGEDFIRRWGEVGNCFQWSFLVPLIGGA